MISLSYLMSAGAMCGRRCSNHRAVDVNQTAKLCSIDVARGALDD